MACYGQVGNVYVMYVYSLVSNITVVFMNILIS